jgi:Predicted ATPase related to phosphate starvation-inducible protein PhoH
VSKQRQFRDLPKPDYVRYERPVAVTENHRKYHRYLKDKSKYIVVCDGYAGTSKSISAVYYAVQAVLRGEAKGIYLVRANEGIGKDIGYTKGTDIDKLMPILKQLTIYCSSFFNEPIESLIDSETVVLQSLYRLQGMDLTGYILIVDEAQLISPEAMYCILTRGAEKVILTGDCRPEQCVNRSLKKGKDGLSFLMHYLGGSPMVGIVNMNSEDDIVRKGYMKEIIMKLTGSLDEWRNS